VSVTAFNALTDGYVTSPDPGPPDSGSNSGATRGAVMGPSPANVAALQGTPPLTGAHNTPLQVGFIGLIALGIVILLHMAGFRFSGAAGGKFSVGR
jgi:hypothetical protein